MAFATAWMTQVASTSDILSGTTGTGADPSTLVVCSTTCETQTTTYEPLTLTVTSFKLL